MIATLTFCSCSFPLASLTFCQGLRLEKSAHYSKVGSSLSDLLWPRDIEILRFVQKNRMLLEAFHIGPDNLVSHPMNA